MFSRVAALIAIFLSGTTFAEDLPPIELFGKLPNVSYVVLSPSGNRLAMREVSSDSDVISVYDLVSGGRVASVGIDASKFGRLRFTNDDHLILSAYETTRTRRGRAPFEVSEAFHLDIRKNRLNGLFNRVDNLQFNQSGLGRVSGVSSDGVTAYMPARERTSKDGGSVLSLYKMSLNRRIEKKYKEGTRNTQDWFLDDSGKPVARIDYNRRDQLQQVWRVDDSGNHLIYEKYAGWQKEWFDGIREDRKALIFIAPSNDGYRQVFELDLQSGEVTKSSLNMPGRDAISLLTTRNRVVKGARIGGLKSEYVFFDADAGARVKAAQSLDTNSSVRLVGWSDDLSDLLFLMEGGTTAGVYLLFKDGGMSPQLVASRRPDISAGQVARSQIIEYQAEDGLVIPALVTAKNEVFESGNASAVVLVHDGPEGQDYFGYYWLAQYFASRGHVVLQPQYRGSLGFGIEFRDAGHGQWGRKMQTDLHDGVRSLVESGLVDGSRVCIAGRGYGGFAALSAVAFKKDMYKCAISVNGYTDLELTMRKFARQGGRQNQSISYWEEQLKLDRLDFQSMATISPARHADRIKVPVLVMHTRDNTDVLIEHGVAMHKALEKEDKTHTWVEIKDGDHSLSEARTRLEVLREIDVFLEANL